MTVAALVGAYLIGAIPVGYLVTRALAGTDIRRHGSGNIGTTNVLRTVGRPAAVLTLLGDVAKGYGAVLLGHGLLGGDPRVAAACGVLAVVGNCWPVYLGFRGGKGVATALGAFLRLMPLPTLPAAVLWILVVGVSRYVSLGSVVAAVAVPIGAIAWHYPVPSVVASVLVACIIIARHRDNIARLFAGTERRLGHHASA